MVAITIDILDLFCHAICGIGRCCASRGGGDGGSCAVLVRVVRRGPERSRLLSAEPTAVEVAVIIAVIALLVFVVRTAVVVTIIISTMVAMIVIVAVVVMLKFANIHVVVVAIVMLATVVMMLLAVLLILLVQQLLFPCQPAELFVTRIGIASVCVCDRGEQLMLVVLFSVVEVVRGSGSIVSRGGRSGRCRGRVE